MAYCTNCGTHLNETAKFCKQCGKSVSTKSGNNTSQHLQPTTLKNNRTRNIAIIVSLIVVMLIFIKPFSSVNKDKGNPYDRIEISQLQSDYVNNNLLVQKCGFGDELKVQIKKILSDDDPDPKNLSGQFCGVDSHPCKYCGDPIEQNTVYVTKQERLNSMLDDPYNNLGVGALSLIDDNWNRENNENIILELLSSVYDVWSTELKNEVKDEFEIICNDFSTGNKYECVIDGNRLTFCSLECRNRYEYYN